MIIPSILIVPGKYNNNKLISQIPVNESADFTVSRLTTATRVNSNGLINLVTNNVPRIDYLNQSCPALLVEAAGTNFARWVNQMTAQDTPAASGGMTITTGSTDFLAPDGTSGSITKYVGGAASGNSQYAYYTGGGIVVTAAGQHTFSLFVKAGATNPLNFCTLNFTAYSGGSGTATSYFSLASGTALTAGASIQDYGNGWYRLISAPYTIASGDLDGTLIFGMAEANNDISWPASGALGLTAYTWGAQLETGSVATTYIPTTTGTGSRAADVISASGALVSGLIGQTEGTIYAEVDVRSSSGGSFISIDVGDGSNFIIIAKSSNFTILVQLRRANGSVVAIITSSAVSIGVHKIALAYTNGNYVLYIDGNSGGISSDSTNYPASTLTRCSLANTSYGIFNDRLRAAAIYTTRLSNNELQLLTKL
jgi:hypothetical protein